MSTPVSEAKRIFLAAVEHGPAEAWPAFLDSACGTDTDLRKRVEQLLAAHCQANSLLDGGGLVATLDAPPAEAIGTLIGPYKLLEAIGEGGMGLVYMAEQQQPVRRMVALKIIKPGMDSRQVIARFEAERQALALMDHPHIARFLDAGVVGEAEGARSREEVVGGRWSVVGGKEGASPLAPSSSSMTSAPRPLRPSSSLITDHRPPTTSSRPYFVMELVRGVPITEFCDQKQLSIRERLALFIQVCQAVQHAHQKGISTATSSRPTSWSPCTTRSRCPKSSTSASPRRSDLSSPSTRCTPASRSSSARRST